MPIILNFTHWAKRLTENELIKIFAENIEKTDGITDVSVIRGGINSSEELKILCAEILDSKNHNMKYLNFYKRETTDSSDLNYQEFNYIPIQYKHQISLPVEVLENKFTYNEYKDFPLSI